MGTSKRSVGARVQHARQRSGRTQAAVAGLCGITEEYLSQIERGLKMPSVDVLLALAHELDTSVSLLLDGELQDHGLPSSSAASVTQALMSTPADGPPPLGPEELRERVESVWRIWQTSPTRFTDAAAVLPGLITDVERAVRAHRAADVDGRRETLRCAADLYGMLRSYCRRTGRVDLALMVADRARRAAEDADDPIRIAAAQWNMGHVLLSSGEPEGAEGVAHEAAQQLRREPSSPESVAMTGALELVLATSAMRRKRWWEARERLEQEAKPLAYQIGDDLNTQWTVFGPTNVHLHQLSVEMESGEASEALRIADRIDTDHLPSRERHFTFNLEVARCCAQRRDDAAALVLLLELEELAPEDLMHSPEARQLITELRARVRPTYRRQVVGLAARLGLP
ncbi:helix-turn-helix transcriptional regulator [Streptomyces sp. ODS28]|uniref:helix-turn-helix domain-containing protein n=1 Tax=Streptomyces sp. ODS28 TaxID=3136688 RepID=UPI0031EC91C1